MPITVYYQNVRGLRTKCDELLRSANMCDHDIIALSETWLHNDIGNLELFSDDYAVYRMDRRYSELNCARGGGVLIAARRTHQCSNVSCETIAAYDAIWICINFSGSRVLICCVYFPPHSRVNAYQHFCDVCEELRNRYDGASFLIYGDFNMPSIEWIYEDETLVPRETNATSDPLLTSMSFLELHQMNDIRNQTGRILDLVFADGDLSHFRVSCADCPLLPVDAYHPPLVSTFDRVFPPSLKTDVTIEVYNFNNVIYADLNKYYEEIDWSFTPKHTVEETAELFYARLLKGIDLYVPRRTVKCGKFPRWYDEPLRKLIGKKNRLYGRYRRSGLLSDYESYSRTRREVKYRVELCFLLFATKTEHLIPVNIKHFWSYIDGLRKDRRLPSAMTHGGGSLTTPERIADAFADHFQSSYSAHLNVNIGESCSVPFGNNLTTHRFTRDEIADRLQSLDPSKGAGPDGIPPMLLKNCPFLASPLCHVFQHSFDKGLFPAIWKESTLVPVFKSGDRSDIGNYRGISILSAVPKVMESILTDELFCSLRTYIIGQQHGFFSGRSTSTNLGVYHNFLATSMEEGSQIDVIYTDLSKAFDSVCHALLLKKLKEIGVGGSYLEWIGSYLSGRRQRVGVCGVRSREVIVTSGVPQGSHIGPILFLLFINDVLSCFRISECLLYADDLKFYATVTADRSLQSDLNNLVDWCHKNHLNLNISKCKTMRFYTSKNPIIHAYSIGDRELESVSSMLDLGVTFDRKLSYNLHIDNITLKAFRMLGFVKRNTKHIHDTRAILCLYNALVRSILEYCSVIWSPYYNINISRVERVQHKFSTYLLFKHHFPNNDLCYETRLQLCGLKSLESRRRDAMLLFLYKLLNGMIDCGELTESISFRVPARRTRQLQLFAVPTHRTNYGLTHFSDRLQDTYNRDFANCDIFCTGLSALRLSLKYCG